MRAAAARARYTTHTPLARARGAARGAWQVGNGALTQDALALSRQVWKGGKKQEELVGANKDNLEKMAAKYA